MNRRPNRIPLIGKFSIARWVWTPQYASFGTLTSPRKSFSTRKSAIRMRRGGRQSPRGINIANGSYVFQGEERLLDGALATSEAVPQSLAARLGPDLRSPPYPRH